jgi:hypothetical protein
MKAFRLTAASAAVLAIVAGAISPASAQPRVRHAHAVKRHVAQRQEARPLVVRPDYRVAPAATGVVIGTTAGLLAANSGPVASALGASATVGAGFGFGAIGGVGTLILYCAIARPHQECF